MFFRGKASYEILVLMTIPVNWSSEFHVIPTVTSAADNDSSSCRTTTFTHRTKHGYFLKALFRVLNFLYPAVLYHT